MIVPPGSVGPVVVGCDGSWPSEQAVIVATHAAQRRGAMLVLLSVARAERAAAGEPFVERREQEASALERARAVGEAAHWRVRHTDPSVTAQVIAVAEVTDPAVEQLAAHADLLVLGGYGGGGQVALSLGSTSEALAQAFTCPILMAHDRVGVTRHSGTRHPVVIAGLSRDAVAADVLTAAAQAAAERRLPLLLVHAVPPFVPAGPAVAEAHEWVAALVAEVGLPGWMTHRTIVTVADPVPALLDRAEGDDLLVVGTKGEGRLAGLISGSVCRAVLDASTCDALVVRVPVEADTTRSAPMMEAVDTGGLPVEKLSSSECWSLLRSASVGRLAVLVDGHPDIFPVNHVVYRESVVFRTAEGTKLVAAAGQDVAFEVDGYDTVTGSAWSVVLKGPGSEIRDRDEILRAFRLAIVPWPSDPKPRFLQVSAGSVTGRRFVVNGGVTSVREAGGTDDVEPTLPPPTPEDTTPTRVVASPAAP